MKHSVYVLRTKEPFVTHLSCGETITLVWYHDIDDKDLHIQHAICNERESAEITHHVYFDEGYEKDCELVPFSKLPLVVKLEFIKAWK